MVHLNARSIKSNYASICTEIVSANLELLSFSESWFKCEDDEGDWQFSGYTRYRLDRQVLVDDHIKTGGGVCIYIKHYVDHDYNFFPNVFASDEIIEVQNLLISKPHMKKIIVINVYRPPEGDKQTFITRLSDMLSDIEDLHDYEVIVMGDMNFNVKEDDALVNQLLNKMRLLGLSQEINESTRKNATLDLIFSNLRRNFIRTGVFNIHISDHYPIYLIRKKFNITKAKITIQGRSYIKLPIEAFKREIDGYDWNAFDQSQDVTSSWCEYEQVIRAILDKFCPLKSFEIPEYRDPWMSQDVYEQIRDKNFRLQTARLSNLDIDWEIANNAKNACNKKVYRCRKNFFKEQLINYENDHKKFWRVINSIIPGQPNKTKNVKLVDQDTNIPVPDSDTANYVNQYFTQIGPVLAKDMHIPWKQYDNPATNFIEPFETNVQEVNKLVNNININKSSAIDNISTKYLKAAFKHTPGKLVKIFNMSFAQNSVPSSWKISKVTPIPKSGNLKSVNNYRPISLLPLPCKLLEKIVHNRVYGFLTREGILTKFQGGFRSGHSTTSTLAEFTDDIKRELNVANNTIAAFIDLRKAFDTVDHSVLLCKLNHYGIHSDNYHWFEDYLSNRFQVVNVNGTFSDRAEVVCGVPQGSILGPLLFLLYVNDVIKCIKNCKIKLYADDTVIYTAHHDFALSRTLLQEDLECYSTWCIQNKLSVNVAKTKVMIFAASKGKLNTLEANIKMDDHLLQVVPSYKYLGVILDPLLSYNLHLAYISKTVAYKTYKLCQLRDYLDNKIALRFYLTSILPYLDYADILFMSTADKFLHPLQYAQNKCLKICMKYPHLTPTEIVHSDTKCNYLADRRQAHLMNFMYSRSKKQEYIDNRIRSTRMSQAPMCKVIHANGLAYGRSVEHIGAVGRNSLLPARRNVESLEIFKKETKKHLKSLLVQPAML